MTPPSTPRATQQTLHPSFSRYPQPCRSLPEHWPWELGNGTPIGLCAPAQRGARTGRSSGSPSSPKPLPCWSPGLTPSGPRLVLTCHHLATRPASALLLSELAEHAPTSELLHQLPELLPPPPPPPPPPPKALLGQVLRAACPEHLTSGGSPGLELAPALLCFLAKSPPLPSHHRPTGCSSTKIQAP